MPRSSEPPRTGCRTQRGPGCRSWPTGQRDRPDGLGSSSSDLSGDRAPGSQPAVQAVLGDGVGRVGAADGLRELLKTDRNVRNADHHDAVVGRNNVDLVDHADCERAAAKRGDVLGASMLT